MRSSFGWLEVGLKSILQFVTSALLALRFLRVWTKIVIFTNLSKRGASEAAEGCLASVAAKFLKTAKEIPFHIHLRENKSGRRIWAFLCPFSYAKQNLQFSNILARGNKSGRRIWAFLCPFSYAKQKLNFSNKLAHGNCFLAALLISALELQNIKFTNNHFGHLTSLKHEIPEKKNCKDYLTKYLLYLIEKHTDYWQNWNFFLPHHHVFFLNHSVEINEFYCHLVWCFWKGKKGRVGVG